MVHPTNAKMGGHPPGAHRETPSAPADAPCFQRSAGKPRGCRGRPRTSRVSRCSSFLLRALTGHVSPSFAGFNPQIIADAARPRNEPKLIYFCWLLLIGTPVLQLQGR